MASEPLTINLTTLTPIWTGGVDGKSSKMHVTGIMGSLRWWYEVFVRSVGGTACDPTKHSCIYDREKPDDGLCDVCRIFGATGWSRRFRLIVVDEAQLKPANQWQTRVRASRSYKDHSGQLKTPIWFFNNPPLVGNAKIEIIATDRTFQCQIIAGLVQFVADWASLGARPQMGFGIINVVPRQNTQYLLNHLQTLDGVKTSTDMPSLQNIFFAHLSSTNLPSNETFNLKYDIRRLFAANANLRHFIMGTVQGERLGAKIMMSYPFVKDTTIRIWGWIPEEVTNFKTTREQVIKQVYSHLVAKYHIDYWREFDSDRDTTGRKYTDPQEFLNNLLEGKHDS
jgi:CRISPR-associated protein Cmr1